MARAVPVVPLLLAAVLLAQPALAANLKSRQAGTQIIANGLAIATVTLATAVVTTKAFLVFGLSENSNTPADGQVTGQITGPTTLTFQRVGTVGVATVSWYVVEFSNNVTVQRGSADTTGGSPINVLLAARGETHEIDRGRGPVVAEV